MIGLRIAGSILLTAWVGVAAAHAGHETPKFNSLDIKDAKCCKGIRLADHKGKVRTIEEFRGKIVVVAFGYTNCPDVCPTTLADLAKVRKALGRDARRVQVLFVTVDPARDTPTLLGQYVKAFDPSFIPLRGEPDQVAQTVKDFRIVVDKDEPDADGKYLVYHMSGTYVFDAQGKARLFVSVQRPDLLTSDIQLLLRERANAKSNGKTTGRG